MAITLVGSPVSGSATNGNDVTLTLPLGTAQDDVVVLIGGHTDDGADDTIGPSTAGYTAAHSSVGTTYNFGVWWKVMGATPDVDVVGQGDGSVQHGTTYACFVLRGADTTTPMDTAVTSADLNANSPSITTVTNGAWVIAAVGWPSRFNPGTITGYSNTTWAGANDTVASGVAGATKEVATAGAEDPGAWSSLTNGSAHSVTIAVRPAGGGGGATDLTIAEAAHAHTVDSLALTQVHELVIADSSHGHTVDNLTLSSAGDLVIADAGHAHTADSVVLTQVHSLVIQDASHAHSADGMSLAQTHVLTVADASHGHTADALVLEVDTGTDLVVQDATHSHTADELTLTQTHVLTVADARHTHSADSLTFSAPLFRFEPPTHEEPIRVDVAPLPYYRLTHAKTVYRRNGSFTAAHAPAFEDLQAAGTEGEDYFVGGKVYTVSEDVANELTTAGYSVSEI